MRRLITRALVAVPAAMLLVAPTGAAHAHPWSGYFPAAGVTCTSIITYADGTTETSKTTVVTKSPKKVVTRVQGAGRTTAFLLPGGKVKLAASFDQRESGIKVHATVEGSYPSPAKLLRHRSGSAKVTMRMTLPKRYADLILKSGRTFTMTGSYRVRGVGSRAHTHADSAHTMVSAIGLRRTLRSLTISNVKHDYERSLRKSMRPGFASMGGTDWVARQRGIVRSDSKDQEGLPMTETQVGCS